MTEPTPAMPEQPPPAATPPPKKAEPETKPNGIFDFIGEETPDYYTPRYEPAGFPLIGGNSDIGLQFGGVFTLTHFDDGIRPYAWNMDLVLSASVKQGPTGAEIAQQNYLWQWDVPGLLGGKLRVNPMVNYRRTVNEGYYGLGNASSPDRPATADGRYFQYVHQEAQSRFVLRYNLVGPWDLMTSTLVRDVQPEIYAGSKLDVDASSTAPDGGPRLLGTHATFIGSQAAGVVYDTRDREIFPRSGSFHQLGIKFAQGVPLDADVRYGEVGIVLAKYIPLPGPFLWAERVVGDFQFGNVPFYDLFQGNPFIPDEMPGGSAGIRGVPVARYLGPVKAIVNSELRAMLLGFRFVGQSFHLGTGVFFDTGRIWSDYTFHSPLDGSGLGLKWGAGASAYLLWGQAAIFRMEVAYSPDAVAENPGFPLGIYVEDGVMF